MLIRVRATQIPRVWDVVKFAADKTNEIEGQEQSFYNQTLLDLLNDHAQCFVRLSPERRIQMVGVTKVVVSPLTNVRLLTIQFLYSFETGGEVWLEDFGLLREFAEHMECNLITFETKNPGARALAERLGFTEAFRTMAFRLED